MNEFIHIPFKVLNVILIAILKFLPCVSAKLLPPPSGPITIVFLASGGEVLSWLSYCVSCAEIWGSGVGVFGVFYCVGILFFSCLLHAGILTKCDGCGVPDRECFYEPAGTTKKWRCAGNSV